MNRFVLRLLLGAATCMLLVAGCTWTPAPNKVDPAEAKRQLKEIQENLRKENKE